MHTTALTPDRDDDIVQLFSNISNSKYRELKEVISPTLTIKVVGFFKNGLKSYILNKKKDTWSDTKFLGKNNTIKHTFYSNNLKKIKFYQGFIQNNLDSKFFHTQCRSINRVGPHNLDVISVIIGLILGDGYLHNRTGEGIRLCVRQSIIHKDYLFSLYEFFNNNGYCSNNPPRKYTRKINGIEKTYYGFEFNTYTFRSFIWLHDLFYKKGTKVIGNNIEKYFTSLTLAIWISDDGTFVKSSGGVRIACNSFSLIEVGYLKTILTNKFDLDCTIQKIQIKNQYSIYIKKNSIDKLEKLILPYLHVSMHYKLGLQP